MKYNTLRNIVLPLALLLLFAGLAFASPAAAAIIDTGEQGGRPISVIMLGANEAPGPGDPDGSGTAFFTLNQGQGEICFELTVTGVDPITASHIHRAPAGSPGPVVVPLTPPTSGSSSGCVSVDPDLIKEIRQFPDRFYVNVHNPAFPPGALRGQLTK